MPVGLSFVHWGKGWLCSLFPRQGCSELTPALQDEFALCKMEMENILGSSKPFSCSHIIPGEGWLPFSTQGIQG